MPDSIILNDAAARLNIADLTSINLSRHEQLFPSTTCGFPGMGGAAMTTAEVVVADAKEAGVCVYVGSRLCYLIQKPTEEFYADLSDCRLSSASRYQGQYDRVPQPPEETFILKESKKPPTNFRKILDRAYTRARAWDYSKLTAKPATVLRVSDGAIICRVVPVDQGVSTPQFNFTEEAAQYQDINRFPYIELTDATQAPKSALGDSYSELDI